MSARHSPARLPMLEFQREQPGDYTAQALSICSEAEVHWLLTEGVASSPLVLLELVAAVLVKAGNEVLVVEGQAAVLAAQLGYRVQIVGCGVHKHLLRWDHLAHLILEGQVAAYHYRQNLLEERKTTQDVQVALGRRQHYMMLSEDGPTAQLRSVEID